MKSQTSLIAQQHHLLSYAYILAKRIGCFYQRLRKNKLQIGCVINGIAVGVDIQEHTLIITENNAMNTISLVLYPSEFEFFFICISSSQFQYF